MRAGDCVVCRAGWIWDYPIYDNGVYAEMDSRSIDGDNLARLNDPELDKLIDQARAETDATKRADILHQAQQMQYDQGGYIIPYFSNIIDAYSSKVSGFVPAKSGFPFGNYWLKNVGFVQGT